MKKLLYLPVLLLFSSCVICGGDDDDFFMDDPVSCEAVELVTQDSFINQESGEFTLNSINLSGNNIQLGVNLNGCDLNRNFTFFVSKARSKSLPPQQEAILVFEPQVCDANFSTTLCFDVSELERPVDLKFKTPNGVETISLN